MVCNTLFQSVCTKCVKVSERVGFNGHLLEGKGVNWLKYCYACTEADQFMILSFVLLYAVVHVVAVFSALHRA